MASLEKDADGFYTTKATRMDQAFHVVAVNLTQTAATSNSVVIQASEDVPPAEKSGTLGY